MRKIRLLPPVAMIALVAGCAADLTSQGRTPMTPDARTATSPPTGSRSSASGYITVRDVSASPFPATPPPEPQVFDDFARRTSSPDPAIRATAWEDANGSPAFQAELQRLRQVVSRDHPDNFVEMRLVRDPAVAAEIWFKRDAARTLARHTSDPLFRPRQGGINRTEQDRLRTLWVERTERGDLINLVGIDPIAGVVELGIAVEEAEFRRMAAERGWELSPELKLHFPPPRPAVYADRSLEKYVRAFARESKAKGIQLTGGYSGRIVLEDGCFRLAGRSPSDPAPLVVFGRQARLDLDAQGYLVVLDNGEGRQYRIGEIGSWPGPNTVDEKDSEVRELRRRCGGGPVTNVAEPQSQRLFSAPYPNWIADYARAKSLSYKEAWQEVIACMQREEGRGRRGLETRDRCIRQFN